MLVEKVPFALVATVVPSVSVLVEVTRIGIVQVLLLAMTSIDGVQCGTR